MRIPDDLKNILPETAAVNNEGHLIIACATSAGNTAGNSVSAIPIPW